MLFAIVALNVFDAIATLKWIELGIAREGNPLMAPLIAFSPACFVLLKIGVALMVCSYLWKVKENRLVAGATKIVFSAYTVLVMWHMVGFYKTFELFS